MADLINCFIIDDEPLARKGLAEYINDIDFLTLKGTFDNPLKAISLLNSPGNQLLFLDIQMPKISGLEFFKTLQQPPPVIFTTAYPQYALEGFEVNALDYLVKPISFERFLKAAQKAREYFELRQKNISARPAGEDYFYIKVDNKLVKILHDELLFVEALQNYVSVQTVSKKYITYLTLRSIEEFLPPDKFVKTHKSFIVSASKISSIEGNDMKVGDHHIPISRNLKEEVMERLLKDRIPKRS